MISGATRAAIEQECAKYPKRRGGLLGALRLVQEEHGHISPELSSEVAEIFEVHPVEVMEVVTFYNMFHSTPQPRHQIHVCTNLPCSLRGARTLLKQLEFYLGVESGEATADGLMVIGHEECLGACAYAPMMRVDEQYHEDLDFEKAKRVLDSLE